jgi:hypothetical protein
MISHNVRYRFGSPQSGSFALARALEFSTGNLRYGVEIDPQIMQQSDLQLFSSCTFLHLGSLEARLRYFENLERYGALMAVYNCHPEVHN